MAARRFKLIGALAVSAIATPTIALGQKVSDARTGLAVLPPPGYSAVLAPARGRYTALIDVKLGGDRDTGCKVGFQPAARNQNLSQAEINRMVDLPNRRDTIEATLGTFYNIERIEPMIMTVSAAQSLLRNSNSFRASPPMLRVW
jgi:hypothetical protein